MQFDKVIDERHSVRKFKAKKPDWRKIIEAIGAARKIPLAGNLNTLKFIFVDDEKKINELADACMQNFIKQAVYVVVVCSDKDNMIRNYDERGERYSRQQAGAAIEQFLLKITDLGLASCWVGAFSDEIVKRILSIPDDIDVEAVLPIGYEFGKGKQKRKSDLDFMLYFNKWKNKYMKPVKKPEAF